MKAYKTHNRLMKFRGLISLLFMITTTFAFSQNVRITGKILERSGESLPGASVIIKGTNTGVVSNINGEFSIESSSTDNTIVVSMIGFGTKEIRSSGSQKLDITLDYISTELENVIVIGYGTVSKKDFTGAVGVVKGEDLNNMPVGSIADVLQGKAPGITVSSSSGTPGAPSVVRVRGIGSVEGSSSPLYVVDGLPQNDIDYLNPNDIESIAVHKDASVAAIYGSRGSNGIIIITTKSGTRKEKMSVNYDTYLGIQSPWKRPHMLNAKEFIEYKNRAADNGGDGRVTALSTQQNIDAVLDFVSKNSGVNGTDWWKEITNNQAFIQSHNIGISGGTENIGIHTSLSYMGQDGIIKGSEYERISWRNNINSNVSKRITLGTNFGIIYEKRRVVDENNPATGTIFSAMAADPITPVFRNNLIGVPLFMNDIYNGYEPNNLYSQYSGVLFSNKVNPVAQIERMRQSKYETLSIKGGINLGIQITDFLKFNSHAGMDLVRAFTDGFQPRYSLNSTDYSNENKVVNESFQSNYFVSENTLSYDQKFDKLKIGALVGTSAEATNVSSFYASIEGIINNDEDMRILNAGTINPTVSGYPYSNALLSYFGRITADYENKYLFAANLRRDGSSKFAKGNRWGTFPSASAAWRFSAEDFLESTTSWLTDGKLRVSYGHIGNQNIGGGAYLSTYGTNIYDRYVFGDESSASIGGGRQFVGNPVLMWETSKQFDIGLDLNLFNGKIEFVADYFNKKIENMLIEEPQPSTLGFPNAPWSNIGSMVNRGWEFGLTYNKRDGDFRYSISGNISAYRNEVTSLGNSDAIYGTTYINKVLTKTEVGQPVGYFYGYATNGIFQNEQQVKESPQRYVSTPGDVRYKDIVKDDFINDADRTFIGNPWPDFVYGLTFNCSYKKFDFSLFLQGSQGNDIMNIMLIDMESGSGYLNAPEGFLKRSWNGEGSTDKFHKISSNQGLNTEISDYFVEDGSYMRIKNVQLGYNFSANLLKPVGISQLRVYVSAQNLLTITGYSGLDPEIGSTSAILTGIDQGFYPQARVLTAGLNIKF